MSHSEKVWWVQAEGFNALLLIDSYFGTEIIRYSEVTENGNVLPERVKSDSWTEGYHQGRALLTVSAALRTRADGSD